MSKRQVMRAITSGYIFSHALYGFVVIFCKYIMRTQELIYAKYSLKRRTNLKEKLLVVPRIFLRSSSMYINDIKSSQVNIIKYCVTDKLLPN